MSDPFAPPPHDAGTALETLAVEQPRAPAPRERQVAREVRLPPATVADPAKQDAADAAVRTGSFVLALPVSLVPRVWRDRFSGYLPIVGATIASGVLQLVLAALLLMSGVMGTRAQSVDAVVQAGGIPTFTSGAGHYPSVLLSAKGALMVYLVIEGVVRAGGALALNEGLGIAPLRAVDRIHAAWAKRAEDRRLAPRTADELERRPDGTIVIVTCRPRDWDEHTAIEYGGAFYEVADAQERPGSPRRFVLHLRPHPHNKPLRRIRRYAVDECVPIRKRAR